MNQLIPALITCGGIIGLDRLTKWYAISTFATTPLTLFPGCDFILALNRGISWSLLWSVSNLQTWLLSAGIFLVIALFFVAALHDYQRDESIVPHAMVLGGAVSNLYDRLAYGGVVDFIDLHAYGWHWPTFNVADICIVVGVLLLMKRTIFEK